MTGICNPQHFYLFLAIYNKFWFPLWPSLSFSVTGKSGWALAERRSHVCTLVGHVRGSQLLLVGRTGLCLQVGSGGVAGPPPAGWARACSPRNPAGQDGGRGQRPALPHPQNSRARLRHFLPQPGPGAHLKKNHRGGPTSGHLRGGF